MQDAFYEPLSKLLSAHVGLYFPRKRRADLERGLALAAKDLGFPGEDACATWLLSGRAGREPIEILASHLTVGETYFFRDGKIFDALELEVLPELLRTRASIRIWSAGCCSGEEPYSIAMLLDRMARGRDGIHIFATDINPRFLEKAAEGLYGEWSFRDVPSWISGYFRKKEKGYELLPRIREMVRFSRHNLVEDAYPEGMDIILCRNVLMYFSPEMQESAANRLYGAAVENGWLVVSPAELSEALFHRFESVDFPGAVFYRKPKEKPAASCPEKKIEILPDACLMARSCADRGKLDEAVIWCEKAIESERLDPKRHYLFASILHEMGRISEGERELRKTLYLDPDFILAHFALGSLCLSQNRGREAGSHFDNARILLEKLPEDEILSESDGFAAGRLAGIIAMLGGKGVNGL